MILQNEETMLWIPSGSRTSTVVEIAAKTMAAHTGFTTSGYHVYMRTVDDHATVITDSRLNRFNHGHHELR